LTNRRPLLSSEVVAEHTADRLFYLNLKDTLPKNSEKAYKTVYRRVIAVTSLTSVRQDLVFTVLSFDR
jgi:hypothetical protein